MTTNTMQDDRSTVTRTGKDHRTRARAPDVGSSTRSEICARTRSAQRSAMSSAAATTATMNTHLTAPAADADPRMMGHDEPDQHQRQRTNHGSR